MKAFNPLLYVLRVKHRSQLPIVVATLKSLKRRPVVVLDMQTSGDFEQQLLSGNWPPSMDHTGGEITKYLLFLKFHPYNDQVEVGWMPDDLRGTEYANQQNPANGDETGWHLFRTLELLPNAFAYDILPKLPSMLAGYMPQVSADGYTLSVGCEHIQFGMIQKIVAHMEQKQELFKEAARAGCKSRTYNV